MNKTQKMDKPNIPQKLEQNTTSIENHKSYQQIENPQSVITSADTKLAYNKDKDKFETILIGDVNAFPEGLTLVNNWVEQDIIENTLDALESQIPGENPDVAVNMPKYAFENQNNWLINEKQTLKERINSRLNTLETKSGGGLHVNNGSIEIFDYPVDGYINLSDWSTGLEDITPEHSGANSPYAVWNPEVLETSKLGILETASEITPELDNVSTVNYDVIESIEELQEEFPQNGTRILKADLYGTHGDQVIALQTEDFEDEIVAGNVFGDLDYIEQRIQNEENRVSNKTNRDDDFSLIDEEGYFTEGITDQAILEEGVTGTYRNEDGDELEVLEYEGKPIDIVPLVTYNPEKDRAELQAATVRASLDEDLNANRGSETFEPQSLHQTWYDGFNENTEYDGSLQELVEDLAGRPVDLEQEVLPAIEEAGITAYTVRNQSAEKAAQNYLEQH